MGRGVNQGEGEGEAGGELGEATGRIHGAGSGGWVYLLGLHRFGGLGYYVIRLKQLRFFDVFKL